MRNKTLKNTIAFFMISLILNSFAFAQAPVFTTVSSTGTNVFAGVKKEIKGMEPETYLLKVSGDSLTSKKVSLPAELLHREVMALIPAQDNSLLVITQRTVEQGDEPQFHSFNSTNLKWKKIAEVNCPSFAKMKVEKAQVVLDCVSTNEAGEEVVKKTTVSVSDLKLSQAGEVTLPQTEASQNDLKAQLIGDAFEWKELKVSGGTSKFKSKSFSP